jgi:hypothetical protein
MCISYPNCGILKFYGYIIWALIASSNERGCFGLPFKLPGAIKCPTKTMRLQAILVASTQIKPTSTTRPNLGI